MTTHDEIAIAWAAGLFEGEGRIDTTSQCNVQLRVGMTDEDVVRRFMRAVGCGSVSGPYRNAGLGHKPVWSWCCAASKAEELLALLLPYLGERRQKRAQEALNARAEFERAASRARVCPGCDTTFKPAFSFGVSRRRYCSGACKTRGYRKRKLGGVA